MASEDRKARQPGRLAKRLDARMTAAYRLKSDGKPMRALRALAGTTPTHPMTELGVACRAERIGEHTPWHRPLRALVDRSLAERSGVRGEYMWHITREGLELLTVENANSREASS